MTKIEIVNALRDILQFLEEEIILPDVENFNRKTSAIEYIRKKYPWLKRPIYIRKKYPWLKQPITYKKSK